MSNDNELSVEDNAEDVENTGTNTWNYYKIDGAQSKLPGTKNIRCIFCDTFLTEGRAVLVQKKQMLDLVFQLCKNDDKFNQM